MSWYIASCFEILHDQTDYALWLMIFHLEAVILIAVSINLRIVEKEKLLILY